MSKRRAPISPESVRPGTIIAVRIGQVWHEGLVSDVRDLDGLPMVINKSKRTRRVEEEPFRIFAPRYLRTRVVGYPGRLPAPEVLSRARARIGEPWTLVQNCERFARSCHGRPRSPTIEAAGVLASALIGGLGRIVRG